MGLNLAPTIYFIVKLHAIKMSLLFAKEVFVFSTLMDFSFVLVNNTIIDIILFNDLKMWKMEENMIT